MPNEDSAWPHHGAQAGTDGLSLPIFINYWLRVPRLAPKPQACWPRARPQLFWKQKWPFIYLNVCFLLASFESRRFWLRVVPEVPGQPRRSELEAATCPRRLERAR